MRLNEYVIPVEGSNSLSSASAANYAVIRHIAKSLNRFSLIHFKGGLISGTEIIGSLNTRAASLKSMWAVAKVRSPPQKKHPFGCFFQHFQNLALLLQLFFSEKIGKQCGTQIALAGGGQNDDDVFVGERLIFLQLQRCRNGCAG